MQYIELEEISNLITRGYTYSENSLATDTETGHPVEIVSFSEIDEEGIFKTDRTDNKLQLKNKSSFYKYKAEENDILLPSTAKTTVNVKMYKANESDTSRIPVYKSNVILIRVETEKYSPEILNIILNNKNIQQRLIKEVYSEGRVKGILLDKLRHFKIPAYTDELKQKMEMYIECKNTMQGIENLIK